MLRSTVIFRCNAGPQIGLGHFVRCLALAEEFHAREIPVLFAADFGGLKWPLQQLRARRFDWIPAVSDEPEWLIETAIKNKAQLLVADSYQFNAAFFAAVSNSGFLVAVLDDEAKRSMPVDVVINQNAGAEKLTYRARGNTVFLLGSSYALLRNSIIDHREKALARTYASSAVKVVVMMGGADPLGLTPTAVRSLLATKVPVHIRVLGGQVSLAHLTLVENQKVERLSITSDVADHFLWCDLAVSAAGSTCWELACLRTPMAIGWAFENQQLVYENLIANGAALPLGAAAQWQFKTMRQTLRDYLLDGPRRQAVADKAGTLVDGDGRRRVADRLLQEINQPGRR